MKKIVWIVLAVAVIAYITSARFENKSKLKAVRTEAERIENATKLAVSQMVSRTNAIRDWDTTLSKRKETSFPSFLTVELERFWLQPRPILFIGSIKDIATYDETRYLVVVERNDFFNLDSMLGIELQLSLLSNKSVINSFLKEHPDLFKDHGANNGVAVVARINAIRTIDVPSDGEYGGMEKMKIGDGELLDILHTGDVTF